MLHSPRISRIALVSIFSTLSLSVMSGCSGTSGPYNPRNPFGAGPAAVSLSKDGGALAPGDLGSAGSYVILSKTGISNVTGSSVTGSIGVSPIAASAITGFSPLALSGSFSTSSKVVPPGRVYAADYAPPTPSNLTTAIGSMETAYTDAAGRSNPDFTELYTGNLGGRTLAPGLYKWSSSVTIPTNVTIAGTATDVWIFQIAGSLDLAAAQSTLLSGGALARNIFWQVAGPVTMGSTSHFDGIILGKMSVSLVTGASLTGRIFSQTMVILDNNTIVQQ